MSDKGLAGMDHNDLRRCTKEALRGEIERLRCLLHGLPRTEYGKPCAPAEDPVPGDP